MNLLFRKTLITTGLLLALASTSTAQISGYQDFEVVESIPAETNLGNQTVRKAYDVWLEMINSAVKTIDIEEFYISNEEGEPLDDIIKAITTAAGRGVQVRLILDAGMYKTYPETADKLGGLLNITVRKIDFRKISGGVQHAKYFIVDTSEIFLGSQNFDWRALKHIHEIGIRIRHQKAAQVYQDIFNLDWQLSDPRLTSDPAKLVQPKSYDAPFSLEEGAGDTLVFSPAMSPKKLIFDSLLWDERKIVDIINGAKKDLCIQVLTYLPEERNKEIYPVLDNALKGAAQRGVSVKMIVSDWSIGEQAIGHLKSLAQVRNIQVKYSSIPEWSGGYIPFARVEHCKYMVADSAYCWIGSCNWEKGYFYNLRNVGVVLKNAKITGILKNIFMKSWDGIYTELIKPEGEYHARMHGEQR